MAQVFETQAGKCVHKPDLRQKYLFPENQVELLEIIAPIIVKFHAG
jgi:hypothetical protein